MDSNINKRTRWKLCIYNTIFFSIICSLSLFLNFPDVSKACVAEMGIVATAYIASDGYRPSEK